MAPVKKKSTKRSKPGPREGTAAAGATAAAEGSGAAAPEASTHKPVDYSHFNNIDVSDDDDSPTPPCQCQYPHNMEGGHDVEYDGIDHAMAAGAIESAVRIAEGKAKAFAEKAKKPQGLQKGFLSGAPAKADTGAAKATKAAEEIQDGLIEDVSDQDGDYDEGVSAGRMPPAAGASGARVAVSSADMDDVEFVDDEGIEALNEVKKPNAQAPERKMPASKGKKAEDEATKIASEAMAKVLERRKAEREAKAPAAAPEPAGAAAQSTAAKGTAAATKPLNKGFLDKKAPAPAQGGRDAAPAAPAPAVDAPAARAQRANGTSAAAPKPTTNGTHKAPATGSDAPRQPPAGRVLPREDDDADSLPDLIDDGLCPDTDSDSIPPLSSCEGDYVGSDDLSSDDDGDVPFSSAHRFAGGEGGAAGGGPDAPPAEDWSRGPPNKAQEAAKERLREKLQKDKEAKQQADAQKAAAGAAERKKAEEEARAKAAQAERAMAALLEEEEAEATKKKDKEKKKKDKKAKKEKKKPEPSKIQYESEGDADAEPEPEPAKATAMDADEDGEAALLSAAFARQNLGPAPAAPKEPESTKKGKGKAAKAAKAAGAPAAKDKAPAPTAGASDAAFGGVQPRPVDAPPENVRSGPPPSVVMANLTSAMASSDLGQLAQAIAGAQDWTSRRFPKDAEAAPVRKLLQTARARHRELSRAAAPPAAVPTQAPAAAPSPAAFYTPVAAPTPVGVRAPPAAPAAVAKGPRMPPGPMAAPAQKHRAHVPAPQWAPSKAAASASAAAGGGAGGGDEDNDEHMCTVCWEKPRQTCFDPCGHHVTCKECAQKVKASTGECPICRRPILELYDVDF